MEMNRKLPVVAQPNVIISPHPISASVGRKLFYNKFNNSESLYDYMERLDIIPPIKENFILSINGVYISFDNSKNIFPNNDDVIVMRAAVHDGGGEGGSDPMRIALNIAVIAASQGTLASSIAFGNAAVGSAIILVGGMLLINALVPIKVPKFDESQPSPTYSLLGSSNRSRLYEPLPLVFGTVRMYPDHGAKPFTEYVGRDQMLTQIFNFGLSDLVYSDYKIGETPLSDFIDFTPPEESQGFTGIIENYPTNVDTLSGADLVENAGIFITKTSSDDSVKLMIDISGVSFFVGREEGLTEARITIIAEYRVAGSTGDWLPFLRKYSHPYWVDVNELDIVNGNKETIRLGFQKVVPKGKYEVRVQLKDLADVVYNSTVCDEEGENCVKTKSYSSRGLNSDGMTQILSFDSLKSYQSDTSDYTNQKRVGLTIKANAQLNGRIDLFNAIVSSRVLVWDGSAFVNQISSNPAWQFLSLARGKFDGTRRIYGAGLPDSRIDIESIKLWANWCDPTSKNLTCNIVFDQKMTVIDMLNTIARCGRATTTWTNGKLGVIYDEANKPVTSVFGMSNIILNSFTVNYVTINKVDEVILAFNNPNIGWQRDTVRSIVPGVSSPVNSITVEIPGITNDVQAGREANLIAAQQIYRRRIITWESDVEGLTAQRGEVGILSHDLTQWDYSGRLEAGTTTVLTLDRNVPFSANTQHYCGVRYPDGTYLVLQVELQIGEQSVITLSTPLPFAPNSDTNNIPMDYLWFFAPKATPGKLVKITDITPINENRVKIQATDEDDSYYLSESNSYVYVTPNSFLGNIPIISNLNAGESLIIVGAGFGSVVNLSWEITGEYGGAFIRAGDEDNPLRDIGKTLDTSFSFNWRVGKTVIIEVVAFSLDFKSSSGSRATKTILLVGKKKAPADATGFVVLQNGQSVILKWDQPKDIDLSGTEIRYGVKGLSNWTDATPLTEVTKGTNMTSKDVPDGDWTFYAKHKDTSLNYSVNAATSDLVFSSDNDIIYQQEQAKDWAGTLTNFVKHHTGVLVPSSQGDTIDLGWRVFDEFVPDPHQLCTYEAPEIDIGFNDTVRLSGDVQSSLRGNTGGVANPKLSVDYKLNSGAYDGFEDWSIGDALCQQVKHKLTLDTTIGVAIIEGFVPTVDLKERTDKEQFTVSAGGSTVTFAKPFHRTPFASAEIVSVASGTPAFATVTNATKTGADINVYNLSNTDAGGVAVLTLTGV